MRFLIFSVLSLSAVCNAQSMPAFTSFGKGFEIQKDSITVIENMPPSMSQDSVGLCYSFAAATIMQANNCRILKQDCKNLEAKDMFSPLDVARFGSDTSSDLSFESSFRGIRTDGGPGAYTLEVAALFVGSSASEECSSLNKLLGKLEGAKDFSDEMQVKAFQRLRRLYEKSKSIDKSCTTCTDEFYSSAKQQIDQDFCVKADQTQIMKSFAEESYEKFFDDLVTPAECKRAKNRAYFEGKDSMEMQVFPINKKDFNKKALLKNLKSVLKEGLPVLIEGVCLEKKMSKTCKDTHATVISGYARMCDAGGKCYDAVKIQNSWGKSWQKGISAQIAPGIRKTLNRNDDDSIAEGWVAADELLDHTNIQKGTLSWLKDKTAAK